MCGREGLIGGQGGGAGKKIIAGHRPKTDPWPFTYSTLTHQTSSRPEPEGYRAVTCLFLSIKSMRKYVKSGWC